MKLCGMKNQVHLCLIFLLASSVLSCNVTGPGGILGKASPHEKYGQLLKNAGLEKTALGNGWFTAAEKSLDNPLDISVPYREHGYFPASEARAAALRFEAVEGQKLTIALDKRPVKAFTIYLDLWKVQGSTNRRLLAYSDTATTGFSYEIDKSGSYILRIQPELLQSGEYTITITNGPSLAFPVKNGRAESFWGASRDAGARLHEGVDIFAPFRSPALAAANGIVTRVTQNHLGGNVIFLRPDNKDYNLYYAHLDEQIAHEGEHVNEGDTVGLIGTTGNAKGGPPHLHFGIYTSTGAVNPFPFIDKNIKSPEPINADVNKVGNFMRTVAFHTNLSAAPISSAHIIATLSQFELTEITAATSGWYKVLLPDGRSGFIKSSSLSPSANPVRQVRLTDSLPLFDHPDTLAARKKILPPGLPVKVLGAFDNFYFVASGDVSGWIKKNKTM